MLKRTLDTLKADKTAMCALAGLASRAPRSTLIVLISLMCLTALTEGIGIMLLVPFLTIAVETNPSSSRLATMLNGFGLTGNLGAILILFLILIALRALLQYAVQQVRNKLEFAVVDGLRATCFGALLNVEWRWMAQARASDHSALLITNMNRVGSGLTMALQTFATALVAAAYLATALILSWQTALVVGLGGATVILSFSGLRRRVTELGHGLGVTNAAMHQQVEEGIAAFRVIKLTGNEAQQTATFARVMEDVRSQQTAFLRQASLGQAALQVGGAALLSAMVYIGLKVWHIPIPILLPLLLVAMRLVPTLGSMQQGWQYWLHCAPALSEIEHMLADLKRNAEPEDTGLEPLKLTHEIEFHAVSLLYAGRTTPAVNEISFTIPANQIVAIIGESGAGKSSVADILTGIIEPDQGVFTVDGLAITGAMRRRWRRSVSYVQQDSFLFHASIRQNLLWSNPLASEADLKVALTRAAADFVLALPDGLDTVVGDGGVRLSGGERQRIAIARALLRSPALLILDEATSALDLANEAAICQVIERLRGKLTIVLIGHKQWISDIADQTFKVEDGGLLSNLTYTKTANAQNATL